MKKLMWFIGAVCFALGLSAAPKGINVLLVTGGHKYDEKEFLDMFSRMENVTFTHMTQPEVQETLTYEKTEPWDVIVFYDLWQQATDKSKQDLAEMIRRGRSVLFFHHSICSYDNWPEWLNITGGKFIMKSYVDPSGLDHPRSAYRHDTPIRIEVLPKNGIVKKVPDFEYEDEYFSDYLVLPSVKPLIRARSGNTTHLVGWSHRYGQGEVLTFIQGHDKRAFDHPQITEIMEQMIRYLARKNR